MIINKTPDKSQVVKLLAEYKLPTEDITDEHLNHFFGCSEDDRFLGVVGLEIFGNTALLRSLAVKKSSRSIGLGSALVRHAETYASLLGVTMLYLLTDTAEAYFRRKGYALAPREYAPAEIKETREFSGICPVSSAFMSKRIAASGKAD